MHPKTVNRRKLTRGLWLAVLLTTCSFSLRAGDAKIRVGVFDGHGGAQTCIWEAVAAVQLDPDMRVRTLTTSDIAQGALDSIDALVVPGGGGTTQYLNIGTANIKRIKDFIASGKGAVGICAGAYLFSDTPEYACLAINGAQAIDIEHDNRGHGMSKFTLTDEGRKLFPELADRDTAYVFYYEGPVFVKSPTSQLTYTELATMQSDVHEEGDAPANMTNHKPFFIANSYGKGRVFSSIAHPEATPGMMWMIPRMIRWTLNMPLEPYKQRVVNPDLYNREILMTRDDLKHEADCYKVFLYGNIIQKLNALDWLQSCRSWDAKRWVQGLLFDESPAVRMRAARFIAETDYLPYLKDVKAAYQAETDEVAKKEMKKSLDSLQALLP